MDKNGNGLRAKLENELRKLKNKLTIILDDMGSYSQLRWKDEVNMHNWYTKLREIHDICLLIDFIEDILDLQN